MGALSLCKQYKMGRVRNIYQNFATKVGIFALGDRRKQFTEILWAKLALGLNKAFSQKLGLKVQHLWFSGSILRTVLFSLHCLYSLDCLYFWPLSKVIWLLKLKLKLFPSIYQKINIGRQHYKTTQRKTTMQKMPMKTRREGDFSFVREHTLPLRFWNLKPYFGSKFSTERLRNVRYQKDYSLLNPNKI